MLEEEGLWLKQLFAELRPQSGALLLDVGSSNEYFRRMKQPFIDYYVFRPLRRAGVRVLHIDKRQEEGVDVVCDLADAACEEKVRTMPLGDWVLCSNLLEHVVDRGLVVRRLEQLTRPGGYLIVTVPHVYEYHPDPIDTMYRPTNRELETLFSKELEVVRSVLLDAECPYVKAHPRNWLVRQASRANNLVRYHILGQTRRRERCSVAAVILRRPGDSRISRLESGGGLRVRPALG